MKALSIRQPWAWLIVNGYKDIENRDWLRGFRGQFAVHASKTFDTEGYEWVREYFPNIPLPKPWMYERGGVVGVAKISGCVDKSSSEWFFGKYGYLVRDAKPVPLIPCKGQLYFFELPEQVAAQLT